MTASPFDAKTVLLAKHAQHVVLIHFPIGLFIAGVVFDILGRLSKRRQLITAAYYNLTAAALFMVPTVITGILAWQWALDGQKLKGILLMHLVWACVSSALLWAIALIRFRSHRNLEAVLPNYCLLLEACAVLIVIVTAHLGGFLSGVNGAERPLRTRILVVRLAWRLEMIRPSADSPKIPILVG